MAGDKIRVAVIGVGYLGRFHAEKLARMDEVELVGVVDRDPARAEETARRVGTTPYQDFGEIVERIDAATVVTPTVSHFEVASALLEAGRDVLVEKPITATLEEAKALVDLAARGERILQVGHLERFNPAVEGMVQRVKNPLFIECNRIAPFKARATDVDVALDLMIHDLDIILSLLGCEPSEIRAVGVPVLNPENADIVNARLEFPTGCVANVTASRLALKDERKMRIFQPDAYLALDFRKRKLLVVRGVEYQPGKKPKVKAERPRFGKSDPLERELRAFVSSVSTRRPPRVSGEDAKKALACALAVRQRVKQGLDQWREVLAQPPDWVECGLPEQG